MYTMSHGDTSMCQIWYAYVIEQRLSCPFKIHGENIILIEAKDQGHTEVMNVCDTSSMVIHTCAKYGMTINRQTRGPWATSFT